MRTWGCPTVLSRADQRWFAGLHGGPHSPPMPPTWVCGRCLRSLYPMGSDRWECWSCTGERPVASLTPNAAASACAAAIAKQLESNWQQHVARFGNVEQAIDAAATARIPCAGPTTRSRAPKSTLGPGCMKQLRDQRRRGSGPPTCLFLRIRGARCRQWRRTSSRADSHWATGATASSTFCRPCGPLPFLSWFPPLPRPLLRRLWALPELLPPLLDAPGEFESPPPETYSCLSSRSPSYCSSFSTLGP